MVLSEDSLRGRPVISADGQVIGTIKSLFIDPAEWRVASICVAVRKELSEKLGVNRGMFRRGVVEIPVRMFQSVGETAVLGVPAAQLRNVTQQPTPPPTVTAPAR